MKRQYYLSVFLTLTIPITILTFAGVFAGSGLAATGDCARCFADTVRVATFLVTGVFLGSALWWFLLGFGASLFRTKVNAPNLSGLNKISGLILLVFGVIALHSSG